MGLLSAILSREFGPKYVTPKYSSGIEFPGGTIDTEMCGDRNDHGYTSSFWFELNISVKFPQVDVLQLLRKQLDDYKMAILHSAYLFSASPDLGEVTETLHTRGIHLKERTEDELVLDAKAVVDVGSEITIRQSYKGTEVRIGAYEITYENAELMFQKVIAYLGS